jgi:hypothetical protein
MPRTISAREQAEGAGANPRQYGDVGEANTATVPLPRVKNAALTNADPALVTGR